MAPSARRRFRPALALLLGVVFVLVFSELALRLLGLTAFSVNAGRPGLLSGLPEPDSAPGAVRILFIGNSHTQGAAETPEGNYPAQVDARLKQLAPGKRFQIVNAGRGNMNSSENLANLPDLLRRYRPTVVFAMICEPNAWNYHYSQLDDGAFARAFDLLRVLKVVRLLDLLRRFQASGGRAEIAARYWGLDLPDFEYPVRAASWAAYLDELPDLASVNPTDLRLARDTLARWAADARSRNNRLVLATLLRLQLLEGDTEAGAATARRILDLPGHPFDLRAYDALRGAGGQFEALAHELSARSPAGVSPEELARGVPEGAENIARLETLTHALPGKISLYQRLASLYRGPEYVRDRRELFLTAIRENPEARDTQAFLDTFTEISQEERKKRYGELAPPLFTHFPTGSAGEGGRIAFGTEVSRTTLDEDSRRVQAWALGDLRRTADLVGDSGAQLVLQTYPLYRESHSERWPDHLIRQLAAERGLPLLDTSARFAELFREHDPESFYFKPNALFQDDHLNTAGNAVVAGMIVEQLRKLGLL